MRLLILFVYYLFQLIIIEILIACIFLISMQFFIITRQIFFYIIIHTHTINYHDHFLNEKVNNGTTSIEKF